MFHLVRCILFDAVGTLIYPDPPVAAAYHAAARQFGSRVTVAEIAARFPAAFEAEQGGPGGSMAANQRLFREGGRPDRSELVRPPTSEACERQRWRRIVRRVIDDVDQRGEELFEALWRHFAQPHHWQLFDDVEPVLSELARNGYRLGIASNLDRRLYAIVAGHPPLARCSDIFLSSEIGFSKPDPRYFAAVSARLALPADQILLVGDDELNDIVGGQAAGWRTLRLDRDQGGRGGSLRSLRELHQRATQPKRDVRLEPGR